MKKLVLLFIIAFIFTGCWEKLGGPSGKWYVKNNTDQVLKLAYSNHDFQSMGVKYVAPGDSIDIAVVIFEGKQKKPYFSYWLERANHYDLSFNVLSESGNLLKEWSYKDKDLPCKQLFNESSWKYYPNTKEQYQNGGYIGAIWVFEILPEDLIGEKDE